VGLLDATGGQAVLTATEPEQLPRGARDRVEVRLREGAELILAPVDEESPPSREAA
jgi:hypothetical protein